MTEGQAASSTAQLIAAWAAVGAACASVATMIVAARTQRRIAKEQLDQAAKLAMQESADTHLTARLSYVATAVADRRKQWMNDLRAGLGTYCRRVVILYLKSGGKPLSADSSDGMEPDEYADAIGAITQQGVECILLLEPSSPSQQSLRTALSDSLKIVQAPDGTRDFVKLTEKIFECADVVLQEEWALIQHPE